MRRGSGFQRRVRGLDLSPADLVRVIERFLIWDPLKSTAAYAGAVGAVNRAAAATTQNSPRWVQCQWMLHPGSDSRVDGEWLIASATRSSDSAARPAAACTASIDSAR